MGLGERGILHDGDDGLLFGGSRGILALRNDGQVQQQLAVSR